MSVFRLKRSLGASSSPESGKQQTKRVKGKICAPGLENTPLQKILSLRESLMKYELRLIALLGASTLAKDQIENTKNKGACPLCEKQLKPDSAEFDSAIENMEQMRSSFHASLYNSQLLQKRRRCISLLTALKEETGSTVDLTKIDRSRHNFNSEFINGMVLALREKKKVSMQLKKCVCCGAELDSVAQLLKNIDYSIRALELRRKTTSRRTVLGSCTSVVDKATDGLKIYPTQCK